MMQLDSIFKKIIRNWVNLLAQTHCCFVISEKEAGELFQSKSGDRRSVNADD